MTRDDASGDAGPATPVRLVLANDSELVVHGLRTMLEPYHDRLRIVGTAVGEPEILIESIVDGEVDVMCIDTFSRSGAGLDAARMVLATKPDFALAIFTDVAELRTLFAALRLGVRGYLLKTMSANELVAAFERLATGRTVIDAGLGAEAAMLAARTTATADWEGAHLGLSRREAEVLRSLATGAAIDAIARELGVGRETVRSHLRQIYRKLGVNERAAAVAVAWREGLGA